VELAKMARPPHSAIQSDATFHGGASEVQHAVIQPWGIRVQRSIARLAGEATSTRSKWTATSDSLFVPFADVHGHGDDRDTTSSASEDRRVHHGLVDRLVDIERIREISDARLAALSGAQAVRFDATALLTREGAAPCLAWGGWQERGHEAIACEDVWGVLLEDGLFAEVTLSATAQGALQLAQMLEETGCSLACGNVACLIDAGSTGLWWRATQIQAATVMAPGGGAHLVLALAGSPVLPRAGAWRVTHEGEAPHNTDADIDADAVQPTDHAPIPVIRRNADRLWQIAECRDLFAEIALETQQRAHHRAQPPINPRSRLSAPLKSGPAHHDFALNTGLQELHFLRPQLERLAMKSSGEYGRLKLGKDARFELWDVPSAWRASDVVAAPANFASARDVLSTQLRTNHLPTLGIDGLHFDAHWDVAAKKATQLFENGLQRLQWRYDAGGHTQASARVTADEWQISLGPVHLELQTAHQVLFSLTLARISSGSAQAAQAVQPVWQWGGGALAAPALWPELVDSINSACAGLAWPIVATDARLHVEHGTCARRLAFGWGTAEHAQIKLGGWASHQPGQSWFGVTLGSAACPLTLVMPTGVGTAFAQIGVGNGSDIGLAPPDGSDKTSSAPRRIQLQISCPANLAFATGDGSAQDAGSAEVMAAIQVRDEVPDRLFAEVSGLVHASVLGGLGRVTLAIEGAAEVLPSTHQVQLDASLNVGIYSSAAAFLDIDFDTDWTLSANMARGV
jgi:hypothetical protein